MRRVLAAVLLSAAASDAWSIPARPPAFLGAARPWRARDVRCESEMEYRKRMSSGKPAPAPAERAPVKRSTGAASGDVDDIEFFGAVGGGTLTREGIEMANRVATPAIDAEAALQEAVNEAGSLPPKEAAELLERLIGEAYTANVSPKSPQMRSAAALLSALEEAAKQGQRPKRDVQADALASKMDAIFGGGYADPGMVDLD